jgi:outer membrane protein assembly factor BamD
MRIRSVLIVIFGLGITMLMSCNGFEKVKRSSDVNYKFAMANKYYDHSDFLKARDLFEGLMPVMKGTKNFEPMYYKFAMCNYNLKDYYSSALAFKNFATSFPASKEADEASYLHALCLYKLSPKPTIEQTNTIKAMEALQAYINMHPESKHLEDANKYIQVCQDKIEEKGVSAAKLYFNISKYQAAVVCFKSVISDFPDSKKLDEYQYMIVKSSYYYAKGSTESKKEERFVNVLNTYQELVDNYPKSKYVTEAQKYYTLASNNIKKIKNEHK